MDFNAQPSRPNDISTQTISDRLDLCKRKDYVEYMQLQQLRNNSDNDDSESDDGSESSSDSDSDSDSDVDPDSYPSFPITHEFSFVSGVKKVTCLAVNKNATDFLVGAQDSTVKFYNYNQLQLNRTEPYNCIYPFTEEVVISEFGGTKEAGNYLINKIVNADDDYLIFPANYSIYKLVDDKGRELWSSPKGDIYMQDYSLTKGHVNDIQDGIFLPNAKQVITCSKDCTVRKWDLTKEKQESVAFFRDLRRDRGSIDKIAQCGAGTSNSVVSIDSRGQMSLFDQKNLTKPVSKVSIGSSALSLNVNEFNRNQIVVRTSQDQIRIYDARKFVDPVVSRSDFFHSNEHQNLQVSNNGAYLIGTVAAEESWQLHVMELADLSTKFKLNLSTEPTCLKWCYHTNQILIGGIDSSVTTLFGAENVSNKGIKLLFNKPAGKRPDPEGSDSYRGGTIYNSEDLSNRNRDIQNRRKKQKSNGPEKMDDISVFTKKDIEPDEMLGEDPREALLKLGKKQSMEQ